MHSTVPPQRPPRARRRGRCVNIAPTRRQEERGERSLSPSDVQLPWSTDALPSLPLLRLHPQDRRCTNPWPPTGDVQPYGDAGLQGAARRRHPWTRRPERLGQPLGYQANSPADQRRPQLCMAPGLPQTPQNPRGQGPNPGRQRWQGVPAWGPSRRTTGRIRGYKAEPAVGRGNRDNEIFRARRWSLLLQVSGFVCRGNQRLLGR